MAKAPPYLVKLVEPVMIGADVSVRRFILAPGDTIPWHRHSTTDDLCVLLSGTLCVQTREPGGEHLLRPGDTHHATAGTPHRLSNTSGEDCSFLLIQGVGTRDFVKLEVTA